MRFWSVLVLTAAASAFAVTAAAQVPDLSGQFRCVQGCAGDAPALVTQNGWDMRVVNEAGQSSRAWIDHPGHIWAQSWREGAVYSPDGMTIQFDRGTVWRRYLGEGAAVPPPPPVAAPAGTPRPTPVRREATTRSEPARARANAFDGDWSVVILTRTGNCDPSYRFGVRISNGIILNDYGQSVNLQGRVSSNGSVRVNLSAGGQYASGQGRLSPSYGSGSWSGQGSSGYCGGAWQASRRG